MGGAHNASLRGECPLIQWLGRSVTQEYGGRMPQGIRTIGLPLPYKLGTVNCYLIETGTGYVLIDTGGSNKRAELEKELESAGCKPGNLALIVLTHGDFDHTGNAAYLRNEFGTTVAMHADDSGMVERGDMFWNRTKGNPLLRMMSSVQPMAKTGRQASRLTNRVTIPAKFFRYDLVFMRQEFLSRARLFRLVTGP